MIGLEADNAGGRQDSVPNDSLSQFDNRALQGDPGHQCAVAAHVFGFAAAFDVFVIALNADYGITSFFLGPLLKLEYST